MSSIFNEVHIVGQFERFDPMRLEFVGAPDAGNGRSAGAQVSSQGARALVRHACNSFFKRDPAPPVPRWPHCAPRADDQGASHLKAVPRRQRRESAPARIKMGLSLSFYPLA